MGDGADDAERRADREREEEGEPITPAARAAVERLLDPGEAEDGAIRFLLDGLEVGSIAELKRLVDEARGTSERTSILSTAVGIARMQLSKGDAELARQTLDEAAEKTHRLLYDLLVAAGNGVETIEMLIGPRDSGVLGVCPHGIDLDRDFCPQGCRV